MKNNKIIIALVACIYILAGCKPEALQPFEQKDAVYFGTPLTTSSAASAANGTEFSFAKYPGKTVDTFYIPVSLLGQVSAKAREFSVVSIDSVPTGDTSSAKGINGVHYKLLPPYIMPANATQTSIPVILYRTSTLDTMAVNFFLKIVSNQSFDPGITAQATYKVRTTYLQKPASWDVASGGTVAWAKFNGNLGTWTKTKYQVILAALYNSVDGTTVTEFPGSSLGVAPPIYTQYLQIIKNYIQKNYPGNYNGGIGATLRDPDANNNFIQVGPANY